jgi:hypothetical protein
MQTKPLNSNVRPVGGLKHVQNAGGLSSSKAPRMSEYEIIEGDIKKYKLKMDPKKAYAGIMQMMQQPNYRTLRSNNSILFIDNNQDGTAQGIMFTADKPHAFVKSLMQFNRGLQAAGVKHFTINSVKTDIEPFLKKARLNYTINQIKGGIQIVVTD